MGELEKYWKFIAVVGKINSIQWVEVFWVAITGADSERTCEFSKFFILDWLKQS